jgi:exopolyphosphatase/guanosine-5'-triphosphate,3'-diphosphate pyrophosphatase
VVARIDPKLPAFTIIAREKDTVRLGDCEPKTGCLKSEVMERGSQLCAVFKILLKLSMLNK